MDPQLPPGEQAALVTGGGRRIGRGLAEALAADGLFVFVHYRRSRAEALEVVAGIRAAGGQAEVVGADLADPAELGGLVPRCAAGGRPLTCLVNSASLFEYDDLASLSVESWDRHAAVNLRAPALLARDFARALPAERRGCVVNLLDNKVGAPNPDFLSYTVSKLGLAGLTRTLALALAPRVRVNGLAPGVTLRSGGQTPAGFERSQRLNPLGRGPDVPELAAALRFVLRAESLTGEVLTLDGGQNLCPLGRDVAFLSESGSPAPAPAEAAPARTVARRIFLRRHAVQVSIGIHASEKREPQRVLVNVELELEPHEQDAGEDIAGVLDYDFVREGVRRLAAAQHYNLQETLCERIAALCLERSAVRGVRVSTEKPDVYPDCEAVGVEIVRRKT